MLEWALINWCPLRKSLNMKTKEERTEKVSQKQAGTAGMLLQWVEYLGPPKMEDSRRLSSRTMFHDFLLGRCSQLSVHSRDLKPKN